MSPTVATLLIVMVSVAGVLARPWRLPEYVFAAGGAVLLVLTGLLAWDDAASAMAEGIDVYFFLTGMMLLAELARREGLFDYLAAQAVAKAHGSAGRLFLIVYAVGTLVTVFLSNDATAVVLTPAVYAAARHARVKPLPYLYICAFVANAASFVLPISNPANLVIYGTDMPPLGTWLAHLLIPALMATVVTFIVLRWTLRADLAAESPGPAVIPHLPPSARIVAGGIVLTSFALLAASAKSLDLGLPTLICGVGVTFAVAAIPAGDRRPLLPRLAPILKHVSWGVVPLVAGLFVLVDATIHTGLLVPVTVWLHHGGETQPTLTAGLAGATVAVGSNLINNLPMGLMAAGVGHAAEVPARVLEALLVGVDLGPNLSVTGSLATILWLIALRREDQHVDPWTFLRLGLVVMPPALLLALGALLVMPG